MSISGAPTDLLVLALVILARLITPLFIPRYPLPAIIACLLLDGVDQTLFQSFTSLPLDGYQGYDKALDVYYLSIAYLSTLRNWTNPFAFRVARFLFYYRLVGVALFEVLEWRVLLFIFPNTFEYFFIWYELVSLWGNPIRLRRATVAGAAAAIWLLIKLPQEYWIHIARLDVTDVIKIAFLGALPETPWGHIFRAAPWAFAGVGLIAIAIMAVLVRLAARRLPPLHAGPFARRLYRQQFDREQWHAARAAWARHVFDRDLLEKVVLVALIVVIFAQILPGVRPTTPQLAFGVVAVVVLTTGVSHGLARRGVGWTSVIGQFLVVMAANFTAVILFQALPGVRDLNEANVLFFIFLLTIIVTLLDRFTIVRYARFPDKLTADSHGFSG
ncbi:hypothetical protein [Promineifilum sp.]|uniref:hypothetical protein n=1 Tax=Promineifilum sp. TaxID=2664178 RepID=UPI0035AF9550